MLPGLQSIYIRWSVSVPIHTSGVPAFTMAVNDLRNDH